MAKIRNKNKGLFHFKDNIILYTSLILVLILSIWLINLFLLKDYSPSERGTFGDMFGTTNSLFSGLALAGIMISILLQRTEIKLQSEEIKATRKEFAIQNQTLKIQRFENIFFNMINQYHTIVNSTSESYYKPKENSHSPNQELEKVEVKGRDAFAYQYLKLLDDLKKDEDNYDQIYQKHYHLFQNDLGHYFRFIYRIIKIVDDADFFYDKNISETEKFKLKYTYICILRSQISDFEFGWLFYNAISKKNKGNFKLLLEKFAFLKNLPPELIAFESHKNYYNNKAFDIE